MTNIELEKEKARCESFLLANGWEISERCTDYTSFDKHGYLSISIDYDDSVHHKIVFLDETGDFHHMPLSYYALLGFLFENEQITDGYKKG